MTEPTRYEIEIRGRATERLLHPVIDDFGIEATECGTTRLVGEILDPSHLNGLLAHFTSMNVEVVGLRRLGPADPGDSERQLLPLDHLDHSDDHHQQKGTTP